MFILHRDRHQHGFPIDICVSLGLVLDRAFSDDLESYKLVKIDSGTSCIAFFNLMAVVTLLYTMIRQQLR